MGSGTAAGYHSADVADRLVRRVRSIDAHAGGGPLRLIVEGFPAPRGDTWEKKRRWTTRYLAPLRLGLLREPRGHDDATAAVLTESVSPGAIAGLLFLRASGAGGFLGHGVIAAITIALERGLIVPRGPGPFTVDTCAGAVEVSPRVSPPSSGTGAGLRVLEVSYRPPPAFVLQGAQPVSLEGRRVRADIAWAAGWWAIVDRESLGIPPESGGLDRLRRGADQLQQALAAHALQWRPPFGRPTGLEGVVLTGPPGRADADLRSIAVHRDGTVDRSPSGSATAAVLAVLDAMGLTSDERPLVHEGPSGAVFRGRVVERVTVGEVPAIVAEITGKAWITGEHTFLLDPSDPFVEGFSL